MGGNSKPGFALKSGAHDPHAKPPAAGASAAEKDLSNQIISLTKDLKAAKD